jgi:predicted Zn-dependent peptidase
MYSKTVLENGVRIVSEKLDHYRSVSIGIWVNAGSREEKAVENGISHFIEHMIFKGTRTRNSLQIAKQLDVIGGLSNAFTGKEYTCFHSRVLGRHFNTLADILSDIFLNSIFDPLDMERERQVILQEISMVEDTPDENIHELFNHLYWMGHPLAMSTLGTGETVSSLRKETIRDYIGRFYTADRIIIAAAGSIDHDVLVGFFQPLFEGLKSGNGRQGSAVPKGNANVKSLWKELEQAHVCLGGAAPHLSSQYRFAGAILNTLLGGNMSSRLFQEIREKRGLAYSVYSFVSAYADTGQMGVYAAMDPQNVNRALEVIQREVKALQNGDISPSDLEAAREHLIGGVLLGSESADTRMMRLAKSEYIFGRYIGYDELIADLEKVTLDEVVHVARQAFRDDGVSMVILGPVKEEDVDLGYLRFSGN